MQCGLQFGSYSLTYHIRTTYLLLRATGKTAPANVSHPWTPRTLNNDTIWHSYMFNWDYPPSLPYMDIVTNMVYDVGDLPCLPHDAHHVRP